MKKTNLWSRWATLVALLITLAACGQPSSDTNLNVLKKPTQTSATDWRDEVIYFALTDRFANGDPGNDDGPMRGPGDVADLGNPLAWHGGDYAGLTQKINEGYFERMGFTALWISPVVLQVPAIVVNDANSPNDGEYFAGYHGYWAEDFVRVDPHFGTLAELQTLVETAHKKGLKIIQDIVVNHAGYGAALVSEHPDWFNDEATCANSANKDQDCPLAGLPDFDQSNPEVVAFLNDFARYWEETIGIDAFRIDTVKHVEDSYWRQFFAAGGPGDPRQVWSVGEIFSGDIPFLAFYLDDIGVPSVFDFPLYFRIKDHLTNPGGNLDDVAAIFAQDNAYDDPTRLTTFVDNHDVRRFMSEAVERGVPEAQARERLDAALSLIYTARGTPSVYYGTEIAMQGLGDPYSYELGDSNREDMDFGALASSALDERLGALAAARKTYPALTHGVQQELWRPNGGAPVMAFRRYLPDEVPVVAVLNNGDTALNLADLPGGGIPLLGTFDPDGVAGNSGKNGKNCSKGKDNSGKCLRGIVEVTGRNTDLSVDAAGRLVGTVPARTLLAIAAPPGSGLKPNPALANVTDLSALAGDGAVGLSWTPVSDAAVAGYRVYYRAAGETNETLYNFAPLASSTGAVVIGGLTNGVAYSFWVVSVDANGGESVGAPTVSATPNAGAVAMVTFLLDARSQGDGQLELRRFDTGSQVEYPLEPVAGRPGFWTTTLELPLFRDISFKFGNDAASAKNSGYEGDGQGDRTLRLDDATVTYEGVYDFIGRTAPDAAVQGTVRSSGTGLAGALVDSSTDPRVYYAITFEDGSYYLPLPSGVTTDLTATAPGYDGATQTGVTAPATGVDFDLAVDATSKYVVDGNLSDWTAPRATLANPDGYDRGFGPDNLFTELLVDWDDTFLYLGYRYRASGNSAILHLDLRPGGSTSASTFDTWRRLASFANPVDFFLAQYEGQSVQLREVVSSTQTTEITSGVAKATTGSAPAYSTEVAIPWTALSFGTRPDATLDFFAGVYGGDGYGAGDIAPNANSTPAAPANTVAGFDQNRAVTFQTPFAVPVTP